MMGQHHPLQRIKDRATHPGMVENLTGWYKIILNLDAAISAIIPDYVVLQVKEKFGGLRYYIDLIPENHYKQVDDLIRDAEKAAWNTCEVCGNPGSTRNDRWWRRTLCDYCNKIPKRWEGEYQDQVEEPDEPENYEKSRWTAPEHAAGYYPEN